MKRLQSILAAIVLTLVALPALAGDPPGVDPLIPGRAIVRLPAGGSIQSFLKALNGDFPINAVVADTLPSRNLYLLNHTPLAHPAVDDLENALSGTYVTAGLLVYGELLYENKAPEGSSGSVWVSGIASFSTFEAQYIRARVNLPAAHARSTGAATVVALLDTGLDAAHPLMLSRVAPGGYNFIDNNTNTSDVGDGIDNDADGTTDELVGHGTYVAGMIAMTAPGALILPVKVLDSEGKGDNWWITKGLFHAIDRGVEVINMSLTSTYDSEAIIDALLEARSRGIVVVAAAGNWNRSSPREYPAMDDDTGVIGVAATDDNDVKGNFSNYNSRLFISAPGASAFSGGTPIPNRSVVSALPGGQFGFSQGTSMATPLLSGAAALIRAQHPEWPATSATVTSVRQTLSSTATNINAQNPGFNGQLGAGRVNVGAATSLGPIAPRPGDLNNDGLVNVADLLRVITDWGLVHSSSDMNGNGLVDVGDLIIVIVNWG